MPSIYKVSQKRSTWWDDMYFRDNAGVITSNRDSSGLANRDVGIHRKEWDKFNKTQFLALKKSGSWIQPRNFSLVSERLEQGLLHSKWSHLYPPSDFRQLDGSGLVRPDLWPASMSVADSLLPDSVLHTKALAKIRDVRWQAPVALAEARKTSIMITRRVTSLVHCVRALRRGRVNVALQWLGLPELGDSATRKWNSKFGRHARETAGNTWLELQYGWLPFLGDVRNSAELLAHVVTRERNRCGTVTINQFRERVDFATDGCTLTRSYGADLDRVTTHSVSKRLKWYYQVDDDWVNTISLLGLDNPLEIAWELVPFSFVVDWMVPVGDYLSNMTSTRGISSRGYSMGWRYVRSVSWANARVTGSYSSAKVTGTPASQRSLLVGRQWYGGSPPNHFPSSVDFSWFENPGKRFVSALALLSQQLSGLRR